MFSGGLGIRALDYLNASVAVGVFGLRLKREGSNVVLIGESAVYELFQTLDFAFEVDSLAYLFLGGR